MKKIIAFLLVFVMAFCILACNEDTDVKRNSKTNTDSVGEISTEDDKKAPVPNEDYVLYKETYTKNGNYCIYEYNDKGHTIKKTWYYTNGETMETTYEYTYNDDGSYSVNVVGIGEDIYEYDAKGRLVKRLSEPNVYPVTYSYSYDDQDREIESKIESETNVRSWRKNTYDDNGNLVKVDLLYADGSSAGWYEYAYDENGREIQQFEFYPDGKEGDKYTLYEWIVEYDEYGRIIEETKKDAKRGGTALRYTYEYDEAGGMCKKADKHMNTEYEYKPLSECIG